MDSIQISHGVRGSLRCAFTHFGTFPAELIPEFLKLADKSTDGGPQKLESLRFPSAWNAGTGVAGGIIVRRSFYPTGLLSCSPKAT